MAIEYPETMQEFFEQFPDNESCRRYLVYAPELSPVEYLWSPIKTKDLGNVPPKGLADLRHKVRRAFRRIRGDKRMLANCLRRAGVLT